MTHQINIFLLLFGALQGWLLSLWILRNEQRRIANGWFACLLIVVGLQLTLKVISKGWLMENVGWAYNISYKLPYLIGPLLFLYVRARKNNIFAKTDLLHFAPFVAAVAISLVQYYTPFLHFLRGHPYTQAAVQLILLSAYTVLALRQGNRLLYPFIKFVFIAEAVIVITLAVMVIYYGRFPDVRLLFLVLTVLIYWISYKAMSRPDLFVGTEHVPVMSLLGIKKAPKYAHSSLKEEEAERIAGALRHHLHVEKLFLDPGLTIDTLAARIGTSRHHLSQVLNERLSQSYVDLVAGLRLDEARRRLSNPADFRFTIASIALDSGFSSVSSFNEVFKKRFGITPSKFREQQLKKMSA